MKSTLYPNIARQIKTTQIYMHDKFIYWCAECGVGGANTLLRHDLNTQINL